MPQALAVLVHLKLVALVPQPSQKPVQQCQPVYIYCLFIGSDLGPLASSLNKVILHESKDYWNAAT